MEMAKEDLQYVRQLIAERHKAELTPGEVVFILNEVADVVIFQILQSGTSGTETLRRALQRPESVSRRQRPGAIELQIASTPGLCLTANRERCSVDR